MPRNNIILQLLQRVSVLETKVDDIIDNHLKALQVNQNKMMWILITTLATALVSVGIRFLK